MLALSLESRGIHSPLISGAISTAKSARRFDERINLIPMKIRVDVGKRLSVAIKKVRNHFRIASCLFYLGLSPHSLRGKMVRVSDLAQPQGPSRPK
jgi:hypothetical protein